MFENSGNCRAIADFDGDVVVAVSFDVTKDQAILFVESPEFADAEAGQIYEYKLHFVTGEALNSDWGTVTMQGLSQGDVHGMLGSLDGDAFITDFEASDYLALMEGEDVIVSVRIEGQKQMVPALRECAARVAQ